MRYTANEIAMSKRNCIGKVLKANIGVVKNRPNILKDANIKIAM
jgi:hypothetical protein